MGGVGTSGASAAEDVFQCLVNHHPGGGTLRLFPNWFRIVCKKCILFFMFHLVDSKRSIDMKELGPPGNNVQGPRQENSFLAWRSPYVVFYCEKPPAKYEYGETAIYDAGTAFEALPRRIREAIVKYQFAYYMYAGVLFRYLPRWMHTIVAFVSFLMFNGLPSWIPLVAQSPTPGSQRIDGKYLQWFGYGRRLKEIAGQNFQAHYPEREHVTGDNSYDGEYTVRLNHFLKTACSIDENKKTLLLHQKENQELFTDEVERAITKAFFARRALVRWEKHDMLVLDNFRWAHDRVNGVANGERKNAFFEAEPLVRVSNYATYW